MQQGNRKYHYPWFLLRRIPYLSNKKKCDGILSKRAFSNTKCGFIEKLPYVLYY